MFSAFKKTSDIYWNQAKKVRWRSFAPSWREITFRKQNESGQRVKQLDWPTASFHISFLCFQTQLEACLQALEDGVRNRKMTFPPKISLAPRESKTFPTRRKFNCSWLKQSATMINPGRRTKMKTHGTEKAYESKGSKWEIIKKNPQLPKLLSKMFRNNLPDNCCKRRQANSD